MDATLPPDLLALEPGGRRDAWRPATRPGLVLLDVDGTLMGPDRVVTDPVVQAVHAIVDAGVPVGFATGRNVAGVATAYDQLRIAGPHVVLNGAQIRRDGRSVRTWPLTDDQRDAVLALCDERDLYAELYTDDHVLVTAMDERYEPHWTEVIGQPLGTVAEHPDLVRTTIKATIVTHGEEQTAAVVDRVGELGMNAGAATSPVTPGFTYVNITHPDADKGKAVAAAAALVGVDVDAVVAIGDGANDLPMLRVVGTAIAMGDAGEVVRAASHHVVPDVVGDGVAVALRAVEAWVRAR
ncbi:HAD family hydrolase [Euzebya sp.]|uniref:HAD family hydrolase n=1 Tax=Euzebya sp. TaxID=1971409 RepID=UPI0035186790